MINRKKMLGAAVTAAALAALCIMGSATVYADESPVSADEYPVSTDLSFVPAVEKPLTVKYGKVKKFKPAGSASANTAKINKLVKGNSKKTIIIPGKSIKFGGPIYPGNNTKIVCKKGAKLTFTASHAVFFKPKKTNYGTFSGLYIQGGTWTRNDVKKYNNGGSVFSLAHGKNICFEDTNIVYAKGGHGIEIIACENIVVKNNKVHSVGKCKSDREEAIQIDIAQPVSAPEIARYGKKFVKGTMCKNVLIQGNDVRGGMAIGFNWDNKKYPNRYHKNCTIDGNKAVGTTANGICVYNIMGLTITNNKAYCLKKNNKDYLYCGIHYENAKGGTAPKGFGNTTLTITGNTAKGGMRGIHIGTHAKNGVFKRVVLKDNKIYSRKSKADAVNLDFIRRHATKELIDENNELYKWK
ncbi:MAG: right-handed parallel beta-helix repeat-containing protein [Eubacteriales bacterium]|nr:right-handed parallel beta-helix repeat-containing protein [Eubacteriales bacterium]